MRIRWPFVRRSILDATDFAHATIDAGKRQQIADLEGKLNLAAAERRTLEDELSRLRVHHDDTVKAKDEAYRTLTYERDGWRNLAGRLDGRLESFGILAPCDWAAPLPCWLTSYVTADIHGVRGEVGGMGGDPQGDDPRFNMTLSLGIKP